MISDLGELLGKGSDGDVYKLEKNKIIKFINLEKINYLEYFILLHLKSNYLSSALRIEINNKNIKIVQEKADIDLGQYLKKKKKLIFNEKIKLIRQLIMGVYFLNSHNIIHGDIKPENLLIYKDFLKLNDFFLSRDCKFSKTYDQKLYTINYRPPECNQNFYSLKSDIWALGCTIYEIYYNQKYFFLDNSKKLYHLTCKEERKQENFFINKLIKGMIVQQPEQRINIEEVSDYFNIPRIKEKKNLFLNKKLYFSKEEAFLNKLYFYNKDNKKYDSQIDKDILNIYDYKIFEII